MREYICDNDNNQLISVASVFSLHTIAKIKLARLLSFAHFYPNIHNIILMSLKIS